MRFRPHSIAAALLALGAAWLSPPQSQAFSTPPINVADMIRQSDQIVSGTVTDVTQAIDSHGLPYTQVLLKVAESIRGNASGTMTFRQIGLQSPMAAENGRSLGAAVTWLACDLASGLIGHGFDLVISNPPYVPGRDKTTLQREVREYEPEVALYGGDDGLEMYRRLVPEADRLLAPGGWLVMEIGYNLGDAVGGMLGAWKDVEIRTDLAGLPRVILARRT